MMAMTMMRSSLQAAFRSSGHNKWSFASSAHHGDAYETEKMGTQGWTLFCIDTFPTIFSCKTKQ
uniref:Uncharacterized protein n=1 Tax=Nelumbo nucifera TaxID=4432 RepID=A0A822Y9F4_NELNU|nr:TPA_asm: hypothetical protein HUJ06_029659 [Nelumbo nucifera]